MMSWSSLSSGGVSNLVGFAKFLPATIRTYDHIFGNARKEEAIGHHILVLDRPCLRPPSWPRPFPRGADETSAVELGVGRTGDEVEPPGETRRAVEKASPRVGS